MVAETMVAWLRDVEGFEGCLMLDRRGDEARSQVIALFESQEIAEHHRAARARLRERISATVERPARGDGRLRRPLLVLQARLAAASASRVATVSSSQSASVVVGVEQRPEVVARDRETAHGRHRLHARRPHAASQSAARARRAPRPARARASAPARLARRPCPPRARTSRSRPCPTRSGRGPPGPRSADATCGDPLASWLVREALRRAGRRASVRTRAATLSADGPTRSRAGRGRRGPA